MTMTRYITEYLRATNTASVTIAVRILDICIIRVVILRHVRSAEDKLCHAVTIDSERYPRRARENDETE